MTPAPLRAAVVKDRIDWARRMVGAIGDLPLESLGSFNASPHAPAAAESYLRRALEALLDLGRHVLAKGFGVAVTEYKAIALELESAGVLDTDQARAMRDMAGYRNRMVHFYDEVSIDELYEICTERLVDVEAVIQAFEDWCRSNPDRLDTEL